MKSYWLNKKQNDDLIIFFNGWGMDEKSVQHLDCGKNDVVVFYDYRDIKIEDLELSKYKNKFLITWSMGTFMSNIFFDMFNDIKTKIAINGTLKPIDNEFGIPVDIYNLTVNNFNELSCKKFIKRMFVGLEFPVISGRTIEELKQELIDIQNYTVTKYFSFSKAVISENDKIIPTKNQHNFWNTQNNVEVKNIQGGHYPFLNYKKWDDILNG